MEKIKTAPNPNCISEQEVLKFLKRRCSTLKIFLEDRGYFGRERKKQAEQEAIDLAR